MHPVLRACIHPTDWPVHCVSYTGEKPNKRGKRRALYIHDPIHAYTGEKPKGGKRRAARKAKVSDANRRAKALVLAQAQALAAQNGGGAQAALAKTLGAKSLLAKLPIIGEHMLSITC